VRAWRGAAARPRRRARGGSGRGHVPIRSRGYIVADSRPGPLHALLQRDLCVCGHARFGEQYSKIGNNIKYFVLSASPTGCGRRAATTRRAARMQRRHHSRRFAAPGSLYLLAAECAPRAKTPSRRAAAPSPSASLRGSYTGAPACACVRVCGPR